MDQIKYVVSGARLVLAYSGDCTVLYQRDENRWIVSPVDYLTLCLTEGTDYTELEEADITEIYGKQVAAGAKQKINEIRAQ